ncbi:MAG: hypothetical protein ACJA01_000245 [Saprospiraceae bacterium]|jgi:uncharacterized protein YxjI
MSISKYKISGTPWIGGKYTITDEHDLLVCEAKRKTFSLRSKAEIFDSFGESVFTIRRKLFSFAETYFIYDKDQPVYRIRKARFSLRSNVFVEALYNRDAFEIQGDIWGMEYSFYRYKKAFAKVSKKMWSFSSHYGVAVEDKEDEILIMAVVITLDLIKRRKRRKRS